MSPSPSDRIVQFVRDPSLQHIELRYSQYSQPAFHRHTHDAYSIGLVKRGRTAFHSYLHSERVFPVVPGDVVLINPGEVHACNPEIDSVFAYYMLYIEPAFFNRMMGDICGNLAGEFVFHLPVIQDAAVRKAFDSLCRSMIARGSRLEIESELQDVLVLLYEVSGSREIRKEKRASVGTIHQAYQFLLENLPENISLQELAAHSGLSPYHFLRTFRREYGLPPHTCQLQMRINQAKRLLSAGRPIAETAALVGFADQSHFTRKFRLLVGATPYQYQTMNISDIK